LLQKKQESLDLGYPTNPEVQSLNIKNNGGETVLTVPWIHPGPLEGFGGGRVTSKIINKLNKGGDEGFFLHVPSTHKSDPANPEDHEKILDAVKQPEQSQKASKMIEEEYKGVKFYGRKLGNQKVVFMDAEEFGKFDDFEVSIFKEILDLDQVLLVDLHSHPCDEEQRGELWYNTKKAEEMRSYLEDFLQKLGEQEEFDYKAGLNTDASEKPVFSLVEEAGDQKTLMFGLEGNGVSKELRELRETYLDDFDMVLTFSTDTHQSIHQLSEETQVKPSRMRENVEEARNSVSKASIGLACGEAGEMKLLQEDYSMLISSINILIRLLILSLIIMYTGLVIWVFF
jgi:putative membrane protein